MANADANPQENVLPCLFYASVIALGDRDPDVSGRRVRFCAHDVGVEDLGHALVVELRELRHETTGPYGAGVPAQSSSNISSNEQQV